ncbi:MAG TPA: hypothetical protein VEL70_07210 [Candidatus Acidoferrum sp.]|nr:hypothetical protein [Candidatus Acidoferrum sp.]
MRKLGLALGVTIAITAMMATPTTNFHVAKAYSCSSSSSAAHTPSSSSGVSGSQGSCSTSSGSNSKARVSVNSIIIDGPRTQASFEGDSNNPGATSSTSTGGSQSSCSSGSADHIFAFSESTSKTGSCP